MKTLYILRHAKSSWDNPDWSDFERPLNERGLKAAPFMGEIMVKNDFTPEIVISSPATRARQTAEIVVREMNSEADINFDERIYEASPRRLLEVVSEIHDAYNLAMIVGHNPGFESLVRILTGKIESMPTAALAVVDLKINFWREIEAETGNLRKIIRPKEELEADNVN